MSERRRMITREVGELLRHPSLALGATEMCARITCPLCLYTFDTLGRLATVAWTNSTVDGVTTASYYYVEAADIIAGYDITVGTNTFRTRKTCEPNRNLISAVSNLWNSTEVSTYAYGNDAVGRRTNRVDSGASSATNSFGYNSRSELVDADMGTNAYGYAYDPIGNRLSATNNAEVWTYLSNELNQLVRRSLGEGGYTNSYNYDLDGNMLTCGGWTFGWNGENRLTSASNGATVVTFGYDYMGRRFMKAVGGVTNLRGDESRDR